MFFSCCLDINLTNEKWIKVEEVEWEYEFYSRIIIIVNKSNEMKWMQIVEFNSRTAFVRCLCDENNKLAHIMYIKLSSLSPTLWAFRCDLMNVCSIWLKFSWLNIISVLPLPLLSCLSFQMIYEEGYKLYDEIIAIAWLM